MMRWELGNWGRARMLNTFGVAALSAVEMDYLPAMASAGFFLARWPASPADGDLPTRWLQAGEALQRSWLTATQLGLSLQPTFATLAFAWYGESGTTFTAEARQQQSATVLAREFRRTFHASPDAAVFLGRIGEARPRLPLCRSVRLPLEQLLETGPARHTTAAQR